MVQKTRDLISSLDFMNRHKTNSQAFTRKRFFKFEIVCVMLLQKTLKSIQLHLHAEPVGKYWTGCLLNLK